MREGGEKRQPLHCECGKLLAYERGGKIFVWCKGCRREVELLVGKASAGSRGKDSSLRSE
ncbi:MAG: hypothetical protein DBX49_01205 [Clostridia bacterium]|nr:MAG: hypothetical protein DBX49_01205 [Clostridia bacterium]